MKNELVTFHYTLTNKAGETLDSSRESEPMTFISGRQEIITGLEEVLLKMKQGEKKEVQVAAEKAYGIVDPALVMAVPRDQFPKGEEIEVGDQFRMTLPGQQPRIFTVTSLTDTEIKVDGNHPLAGEDLNFDVEIVEKREATKDELKKEECCGGDHHHH